MQADIAAFDIVERVIVLRTLHSGRLESISEFYATDSRDGEDGVGNQGLDRVEERFSEAGRDLGCHAFHYSSDGVTLPHCIGNHVLPYN